MIWCVVEIIPDEPNARFSPDDFIGRIRFGDDDHVHLYFDKAPPRGALARLIPIAGSEPGDDPSSDYWEDCPPEIDFDGEIDADVHRAVRNMKGGRR